ncbi:hypothetical protein K0M31_003797 [Melipona bicolor]|uniref:Uncharacterized protein n=1 Tax=Melipona bicolor TaxID=60889 RepID=A0AA40FXK8_9HYME|nr:hypothetical protein K0M31_003797 [Melipona bicolor]
MHQSPLTGHSGNSKQKEHTERPPGCASRLGCAGLGDSLTVCDESAARWRMIPEEKRGSARHQPGKWAISSGYLQNAREEVVKNERIPCAETVDNDQDGDDAREGSSRSRRTRGVVIKRMSREWHATSRLFVSLRGTSYNGFPSE